MLLKRAKKLIGKVSEYFGNWFGMVIGIDLGTCNTLISVRGKGIVLNEPSMVAVMRGTNNILDNGNAIGSVAREMLGKTPESINAIKPLANGVISNFEAATAMLGYFMKKVHIKNVLGIGGPRVVIAVPSGITHVERRAVIETAERAGASKVYLVDESMAAGIGSDLPIANPTASMIVDIGGGTTEVAVISLADIASFRSIRIAGNAMDETIINYLKKTYNLLVGEARAEKVKIEIGSALPLRKELTMEVAGRDATGGMPKKIVIRSEEIRKALQESVTAIIKAVIETLGETKPELAADLIDNGIHICGGGSLLRGMDEVLANATGLTVKRVEEPLNSVARGTEKYIENIEMWQDMMESPEYERV